jgi:hypothetical protein
MLPRLLWRRDRAPAERMREEEAIGLAAEVKAGRAKRQIERVRNTIVNELYY